MMKLSVLINESLEIIKKKRVHELVFNFGYSLQQLQKYVRERGTY